VYGDHQSVINVTDIELSRKLKEAGFPQDTFFWWLQRGDEKPETIEEFERENYLWQVRKGKAVMYASPSAEELGLQLMSNIDEFIGNTLPKLNSDLFDEWDTTDHPYYNPDLLAKLWLYLKGIGLL
jgi:hypothetical protein